MNILTYSIGSWDDTNATGNTFSNLFGGKCWENDTFFNIYMREAMPNNRICKDYYRVTLTDIVKNFFRKEKIGKTFEYHFGQQPTSIKKNDQQEKKIIDFIHKYSINIIYTFADWIYRRKKWINNNFKEYIKKANPDVFYAHVNNFAFLNQLIKYIKNNTSSKIVVLLTDNLYEDINTKSIFRRKNMRKDYKEIIDSADIIYAITDELKNEYGRLFNKDIRILRKGCTFNYPVRNKINETIRFVYAGNLHYGRENVLSIIANAIKTNNETNQKKAILEIYTGDTITKELEKKLNIDNCSQIIGKRAFEEILKIENSSDYVLHVESFEEKQINYVKYSFSTKIIDCMQSGSGFIGIGPKNLSSIKYIEKIPGAYVINDLKDIENKIITLINNDNLLQDSKRIREFAMENHDTIKNQIILRNSFLNLIKTTKGE